MLKIITIPAFQDNYLWLLVHPERACAIAVDPGDAAPVLAVLKEQGLSLSAILITHKHADHVGGVKELLAEFPAPVYGSKIENLEFINNKLEDSHIIQLEHWPEIKVIAVPGHTLDHLSYLIENCLFCGDTLFGAGCGRLFEGTAEQMFHSLNKIKALPDETLIYCAHEYTLRNLSFAKMVEPNNAAIIERIRYTEDLRNQSKSSVPSTLALEKATNPFLRCDQPSIQAKLSEHVGRSLNTETEVFKYLREWRNQC